MQDYLGDVRTAVSHQLRVPVESVHADHVLERDLGVDAIDLAFIIVYLEDMSGLEDMMVPILEVEATVKDLAVVLKPFLDRRPARSRRGVSDASTSGGGDSVVLLNAGDVTVARPPACNPCRGRS